MCVLTNKYKMLAKIMLPTLELYLDNSGTQIFKEVNK